MLCKASLLFSLLFAPAFAAPVDSNDSTIEGPVAQNRGGFVHIPIQKVKLDEEKFKKHITSLENIDPSDAKLVSAITDFDEKLDNERYYYTAQVEIGTPPQQISLLVDTGSSDTWVFTSSTQRKRGGSGSTSIFDSGRSSSFKENGTEFSIQYGKGSCSGSWGTDTLNIGGAVVKHLSIGLASEVSQINTGLLGIGRPMAESTYVHGGDMYLNLPLKMQAEGLINSASYSLALNDLNSGSGTILFGGVDRDYFHGPLMELPITHPSHMGVTLNGMYASGVANYNLMKKPMVTILDSGTSLSYLDGDTLSAYRTAVNSNPSFNLGSKYYTDCNVSNSLMLDFGKGHIEVPSYNFLWPVEMFVNKITAAIVFPRNSCYIGLEKNSAHEDFLLFGDNILRSMYIVYDVTDERIGVAKAKSPSGQSDIEPIMAGKPFPFSSEFL